MALENQQIHTINTDKIFLNNRNDKKTDHIVFETNGILGENNIEFSNCNVDVKTGYFKAPEIRSNELKDADGNTTISLSSSAIDFNSKTINNFSFSTGSISAASVNSANGYASLDAELDALQSQKISITGHTANKVFVSSSGGGLTTSSISTTDLNKLSNISITQAVDLDTIESDVATNNAKTGISGAEQTKLGHISVTQAVDLDTMESNISTNNAKTGITSGEQTKLGHISVSQAVDLDTMESNIATNNAKSGISGAEQTKLGYISVSQAVNLDTMESDIADNISNLTARRIEILANTSNISTNTGKLTGITYSALSTAGTYDITGGNFGGVSSVYSNGTVNIVGGYDGVNSSGDVSVKQNNIERIKITDDDITLFGTSNDNKLIIDDNTTIDVESLTFESQGFVLFKGDDSSTKYDLILDRGDNYWSAFTNTRDWDCYNTSDKYNRNATSAGATMFLQYYSHGDINMCNTGGDVLIGAGGTTAGYLCIGGSSPVYPIDIRFSGPNGNWSGTYATFKYNDTALQSSVSANQVGLKAVSAIWASGVGFIASSDRRIKENIRDVPDDLSLKMLRELPVSYYDYKDKLMNGGKSTIGFIAQEVKEILPMAVSLQRNIIPNEMRNLDNFSWETITDLSGNETFKLIVNDLEDVSGNTKYRFYCSNEDLKEVVQDVSSLENEPKSFIFEKKWKNIFLYGKEIDDFHTIDKQKIFAVAFSATQEIDRIQQQHAIEIANIKEELQKEKNKTIYFEDKLRDIEKRLSNGNL